jgi:uncharacterized protein Usg
MGIEGQQKVPKGYGPTTAKLYYRLPGHERVLTCFVWDDYDRAPDYPELFKFITAWQEPLDGVLHSVRLMHRKPVAPGKWQTVPESFPLYRASLGT